MKKNIKIKRNLSKSEDWVFDLIEPEDMGLHSLDLMKSNFIKYYCIFFVFFLFLFFLRILYLNYGMDNLFHNKAELNYKRFIVEQSLRGIIYDRNGEQLLRNIPYNHAAIIPADIIKDEGERKKMFLSLSRILDTDYKEINNIYLNNKYSFRPILIKKDIDHEMEISIETDFHDISGVFVRRAYKREYIYGNKFSHVLGYLGVIDEETYKNNNDIYRADSLIGKMGIEAFYEDKLKGKDGGKTYIVNAQGKLVTKLSTNKPEEGEDIKLTLDKELQIKTYQALEKGLARAKSGAGVAIVMNPNNGEILAIVSLPDFDPNIFSSILSQEEWTKIISGNKYPFLNRSISGLYPPGSVFKLVTATGVLEEGIVLADDKINSPGTLSVVDKFDPEKIYVYKDWKLSGHGYLDIKQAMERSSDTFFYTVTGGFKDFKGLGIRKFIEYCKVFNIGEKLGIDLPGEKPGLLPSPEWKLEKRGASWYTGDTYNMSIGQGYLLATPLQVAYFTSVVASNGGFYSPHLILDSKEDFSINSRDDLKDELNVIKEGMRQSIINKKGTGKALKYFEPEIAGKTGTAQFETGKREHAWFTAFAPYENPEIVVTVLVEESGEGGTFALPVVKEIMEGYFGE